MRHHRRGSPETGKVIKMKRAAWSEDARERLRRLQEARDARWREEQAAAERRMQALVLLILIGALVGLAAMLWFVAQWIREA